MVCQPAGSIGVITGKFSLEELYGKIGYAKQLISKGRSAARTVIRVV